MREERETEIIVEITYELRAEETGGDEIEGWWGGRVRKGERFGRRRGSAQLFPQDFLIIYRARRISLLCRARIRQRRDFANYGG